MGVNWEWGKWEFIKDATVIPKIPCFGISPVKICHVNEWNQIAYLLGNTKIMNKWVAVANCLKYFLGYLSHWATIDININWKHDNSCIFKWHWVTNLYVFSVSFLTALSILLKINNQTTLNTYYEFSCEIDLIHHFKSFAWLIINRKLSSKSP